MVISVSVSTLLGLSAYLFGLLILSAMVKLLIKLVSLGVSYTRYYLSRHERELYEERFARLAEDTLNGPLLLTDQRGEEDKVEPPQPPERPQMAPVSSHLTDPFERKFA